MSGAVVPGATIVAEDIATGVKVRTAVSDNQGNYEMPDLKTGDYRIRVTMGGFKAFVADNIPLASSQIKRVDVQLQVGDTASEVTVSGAAPVIETEDSKITAEFSAQQYKFAPLPGNAYSSPLPVLATLPNVQTKGYMWSVSMAGQAGTEMGMDGVKEETMNTQTVNMEQAEEVKVVPVNNSAEFSRATYYNVVTKRGTNDWHGEASYYHRNSALAARGFFEPEKPHKLYHTFNLSGSGPIIRNKTFFYALWNGERVPEHTFHLSDVPTAAMRTGDFSQLLKLDTPVVITDPLTGKPFPNNVIPTGRISPLSQKMADTYIPSPNLGGPDALVSNLGWTFPYPEDQYRADVIVTRIDHQLTSKNSLYGRFSAYLPRYVLSGNLPTLSWTRLRQSHSWAFSDTHVFTPAVVNTFTFGGNRDRLSDGETVDGHTPPTGDKVVESIGLQGVNPHGYSAMGLPIMHISGYPDLSVQSGGVQVPNLNFSYADSMSWARGRHVWKFGTEIRTYSSSSDRIFDGTYGEFSFDGRFSGNAYSDFLLGVPATSTRLDPLINRKQVAKEVGIFVTDTFKVTPKLNLDLGLRWDYFGAPSFEDGLQYNWDPATGNVVVPGSALSQVSPLFDPRIKVVSGDVLANPDKKLFVPRIGAAYRLTNSTVIRGGYGIFNEPIASTGQYDWGGYTPYVYSQNQGGGPFQISETYRNRLVNGAPLFMFPNPFPSGLGAADVPSQSAYGFSRDVKNGRIHQYNVTLEHQIHDIGLRASYVGTRGTGLNYFLEIDKPEPSQIPFADDRRPWPQFNSVTFNRNNGKTRYNALTLQGTRRVGSMMFDAHWTWAHAMSNMLNLENPYAPLFWNRDWQAKQRFVLNFSYDLPFGRGKRFMGSAPKAVDAALGGWKFYWISYLQSGQYFSPIFSGYDPSNTGTFGGVPDRIANGNLDPSQRSIQQWFDPNAFTVPGCPATAPACDSPANIGRFGNSGRNILEGPGLQSHGFTLAKRFAFTERVHFDFMAMVSNLFNHPNFHTPEISGNNDITVPGQVGVISAQHDVWSGERAGPRVMELRGRIEF
jgi:hypothetical protein